MAFKSIFNEVNKALAPMGFRMYRAREGYYYFMPLDINDPRDVESIMTYSLDGITVDDIVAHVQYDLDNSKVA
jgi:hypothetical protein